MGEQVDHSLDLARAIQRHTTGRQLGAATGLAAAYTWYERGDLDAFHEVVDFLYRHGLPVRPERLGLSLDEFAELTGNPATAMEFVDHVHARTAGGGTITPEGRVLDQ